MITITLEGKEYQLDIEQAKKLNLLKEKDNRVKSWQEFLNKYIHSKGYVWNDYCNDIKETFGPILTKEQFTPHEAKALATFSKLLKLRRDWIGEWEPDWCDSNNAYGIIWANKNQIKAMTSSTIEFPLSFPNYKMAQEFLETFHDLIEEAKILI